MVIKNISQIKQITEILLLGKIYLWLWYKKKGSFIDVSVQNLFKSNFFNDIDLSKLVIKSWKILILNLNKKGIAIT